MTAEPALSKWLDVIEEGTPADVYEAGCNLFAALKAASPRMVSTVAELDALPVDSIIRSADGVLLEKSEMFYYQPGWGEQISRAELEGGYGEWPYTVLWVGGTE